MRASNARNPRRSASPFTAPTPPANPPGLLKWVLAMVNYFGVAKGVEPKRKKVRLGFGDYALRIQPCDLLPLI